MRIPREGLHITCHSLRNKKKEIEVLIFTQTLRPYRCPQENCTFKPDCRWENLKRHLRRSGHCPQLLVETSDEYKLYRESVRREIDDWHKRNEDGGLGRAGRRKGGRTAR